MNKMDKNWGGMEVKKVKKIYFIKNIGKDVVCFCLVIIVYFFFYFYYCFLF